MEFVSKSNIVLILVDFKFALNIKFQYYLFYITFQNFYIFSDSSIITIASWTFNYNEFGVSPTSQYDLCYFKYNSNQEFKWSTSIDFLNGIEERESIYEFKSTAYIAITTAKYYYCILNLNITSGLILKSQWAFVYKPSDNTEYRKLDILLATDEYIYSGGNDVLTPRFYALYLFELSTLKLVKYYDTSFWLYAFGFRNSLLERDEFYCESGNYTLYSTYFTQEINESNESTGYEKIHHDLSLKKYNFYNHPFNLK